MMKKGFGLRTIVYRSLYVVYCIRWKIDHFGKAFKGMKPASFAEWIRNDCLAE